MILNDDEIDQVFRRISPGEGISIMRQGMGYMTIQNPSAAQTSYNNGMIMGELLKRIDELEQTVKDLKDVVFDD